MNTGLSALSSNAQAVVLPAPDPTAPMTDAEKAAWAQQSALSLEQLLRDGEIDDMGRPKHQPRPESAAQGTANRHTDPQLPPARDGPASTGLGSLASEPSSPVQPTFAPPTNTTPAAETPPPDPIVDLASKMAGLLRPAPGKSKPALSDTAALMPIEAMQPGALATLDSAESPLARALDATDLATLLQARSRLLANPPAGTPADFITAIRGSAAPVATVAPTQVSAATPAIPSPTAQPFRITRTALCTRVSGFGRFDPYASTTFVAGRPIRAIVYAELDGFGTRPAKSGDPLQPSVPMSEQTSVQLSQTLTLFHDRDGLLAWHRPAQSVTETSRSARRDFYLIQIVELPATLSVGRYNLKVIVADATSGAEAESIIPIDIVADPSLVSQSR